MGTFTGYFVITDKSGKPLNNATVELLEIIEFTPASPDPQEHIVATSTTDEAGEVTFGSLDDTKRYFARPRVTDARVHVVLPTSVGGSGAPASASFVTIDAEAGLSAETQHSAITGASLHVPKVHGRAYHTENNAWKVLYTDASGDEQELALGADGEVFTSTGAAGVPAFEAPAAGGATTALDNLASVAINTSLISDADSTDDLGSAAKYWANAYTDKLYLNATATLDGATAGIVNVTGRTKLDTYLGVYGTTPSTGSAATRWIYMAPSSKTWTQHQYGIYVAPSSCTMNATKDFVGVFGDAPLYLGSGVTSALTGLQFGASAYANNVTATASALAGIKILLGGVSVQSGAALSITDAYGLWVQAGVFYDLMALGGTVACTDYYMAKLEEPSFGAGATLTNLYGLHIDDCSAGGTINRILELGPTPYLRLLGSGEWTAAANETPLYLAYGGTPTLGQVQYKAGDALGAGDKVLVVV